MYELHEKEQYFWDDATAATLADFISAYQNPCCLCAPLLGQELVKRKRNVAILDCDDRFSHLPGFIKYDLYKPARLSQKFDIIICDPPFFNVSLSQLFKAIRLLSQFEYSQPLLLCYLSRRAANLMGTFANFNLKPTSYKPGYRTVQSNERNEIEFFGNLENEELKRLQLIANRPSK